LPIAYDSLSADAPSESESPEDLPGRLERERFIAEIARATSEVASRGNRVVSPVLLDASTCPSVP
jgi:hypothetical protein